jgi:hypothetical protein
MGYFELGTSIKNNGRRLKGQYFPKRVFFKAKAAMQIQTSIKRPFSRWYII